MTLSRRELLRKTGAAIAALGLAELIVEWGMPARSEAYGQSLTRPFGQGDRRKLALLIGIDNYPNGTVARRNGGQAQLKGCETDIALQRELLIHRFGFLPSDVVCLTNEQATRAGIYEAFVSHLYEQATSGDVVVVHFSGYGGKVRLDEDEARLEGRSLVPFDGFLPKDSEGIVNDISEVELKSLLGRLKTKRVTTVLDAGFVDLPMALSGGLRSRYRGDVAVGRRPETFPLLADERLIDETDSFPGVLLRGGSVDEAVLERPWDGFSAGAFTYVMTQYLWSAPSPVSTELAVGRARETLVRWGGSSQQPDGEGGTVALKKNAPIYNADLLAEKRGSGVVQSASADGKRATLWLGGLPPRVLKYLESESVLNCGSQRLRIQSRKRLVAEVKRVDEDGEPLQVGDPVVEAVRVLPKDIALVVALDSRLERIERVDATSALSALAFVSSTSGTDLPADCLLGKPVTQADGTLVASKQLVAIGRKTAEVEDRPTAAEVSGYGLFSLTRSLIPGTLAQQDEAINPAVARLTPKLKALLALKLLRLTENRASSLLPVRVTLEAAESDEKLLIGRRTIQSVVSGGSRFDEEEADGALPEVEIGTRVRYRLFNEGDRPLYYTLLIVNPRERISAFCPTVENEEGEADGDVNNGGIEKSAIPPGGSVAIPNPELDWSVDAAAGPVETYITCSTQPLVRTFNQLLSVDPGGSGQRISPLPEPLNVVESLLADISASEVTDEYRLDVATWTTLNFTYRAV